jgi:hypothetical protein
MHNWAIDGRQGMTITAAEFLKRRGVRLGSGTGVQAVCAACHRPLQETITGNRRTDMGHVCSDCYFEKIGAVVEEHPVTTAHSRG